MNSQRKKLFLNNLIFDLQLSVRAENALMRSGIRQIGDLLEVIEGDQLSDVRNVGVQTVAEIIAAIDSIVIIQENVTENNHSSSKEDWTEQDDKEESLETIIQAQATVIREQIQNGLIHPGSLVAGNPISHWLEDDELEKGLLKKILLSVIDSPKNISDELSFMFSGVSARNINIFILKHYDGYTLQNLGEIFDVSRERVRQIISRVIYIIRSRTARINIQPEDGFVAYPGLIRFQTACLIAEDLGLNITYNNWLDEIRSSGLIGSWGETCIVNKPLEDTGFEDLFKGLLRYLMNEKTKDIPITIPENLKRAMELEADGYTDIPASTLDIIDSLSKKVKKTIHRHAGFTGSISVSWLAKSTEIREEDCPHLLSILGYELLVEDWYIPKSRANLDENNKSGVFHRAVRKMLSYCGPLDVENLRAGLEHAIYRTSFLIPPPDVLNEILARFGYKKENGKYHWVNGKVPSLSNGEQVIWNCIKDNGPIVHHSLLAEMIVESGLSFPALHKTLNYSPLFEKVDHGIYRIRGTKTSEFQENRALSQARPRNQNEILDNGVKERGKIRIRIDR